MVNFITHKSYLKVEGLLVSGLTPANKSSSNVPSKGDKPVKIKLMKWDHNSKILTNLHLFLYRNNKSIIRARESSIILQICMTRKWEIRVVFWDWMGDSDIMFRVSKTAILKK